MSCRRKADEALDDRICESMSGIPQSVTRIAKSLGLDRAGRSRVVQRLYVLRRDGVVVRRVLRHTGTPVWSLRTTAHVRGVEGVRP